MHDAKASCSAVTCPVDNIITLGGKNISKAAREHDMI